MKPPPGESNPLSLTAIRAEVGQQAKRMKEQAATQTQREPATQQPDQVDYATRLEAARVRPTDIITKAPICLCVEANGQQYRVGTLGNISTIAGKAKSKKTFAVSFAIAAAVGSTVIIDRIRGQLPTDKQTVLLFDTEQSREDVHAVVTRICRLCTHDDPPNLITYSLRDYSPDERLNTIDYALNHTANLGLVIIDGVRDLAIDPITDSEQASRIMTYLLQWSSRLHIHIMCVLHENKHDRTLRGFLGTEIVHKSETVLSITKNPDDKTISTVAPEYCRGQEFEPFSFTIDETGLPILIDFGSGPNQIRSSSSKQDMPLTNEQITVVIQRAFAGEPGTYTHTWRKLIEATEHHGFTILGQNAAKQLLASLQQRGYVDTRKDTRHPVYVSTGIFPMD